MKAKSILIATAIIVHCSLFAVHCFAQGVSVNTTSNSSMKPPTYSREIPFTLDDRDRAIRLEERMNSLRSDMNSLRNEMNIKFESMNIKFESMNIKFESMNTKFESMNTKFESIDTRFNALYWAFGILITLMLFQLGYVIWDRRTALHPLLERTFLLSEKDKQLEKEIEELKKLKEVIKSKPKQI